MTTVTLTLAKAHLNIDHSGDDELIEHYLEAAESWITDFIGKPFPDPVPASLKQAVLQLAAHFYENREATLIGISAGELPFGVIDLIRPHRDWSFHDEP
ncbi:phage gp6-like head-tail connector protein [Paraburkholderia aspalathi]|nr:phage gp6-like head-tail connector protein [Paraburkholderia aspalathi]